MGPILTAYGHISDFKPWPLYHQKSFPPDAESWYWLKNLQIYSLKFELAEFPSHCWQYIFIQTLSFRVAMTSWQFFPNSRCHLHARPIQANTKVREFKKLKNPSRCFLMPDKNLQSQFSWTTDQHKTGQLIYSFPWTPKQLSYFQKTIWWIYSKLRRINLVYWMNKWCVSLLEEINLQISIGGDSWLIGQRLKSTVNKK